MADNYNDRFEEWKNTGKIEQVPKDMFGITETQEQAQPQPENETKKTSFAELRQGRKVPRLKKSMVLTIITGGVFVFLMLVNLIMQKKEKEKRYFDEQKNAVAVGSEFSLGDLEKRARHNEIEQVEVIGGDDHYFKSPPAYTPVSAERVTPPPSGGGGPYRPAAPGGYSESDLLAVKAQIGKDGGYGIARNASYTASYTPPGNYAPQPVDFTPQGSYPSQGSYTSPPTREEYTRQRLDDITRLTQMTNNDGSTRYTGAGRYNPNNPQRGADTALLNDACLFPGTIIHAILVSRIDTDYPGPIHARVIENVYDSKTGKNLLIPQGTILQGNYSSSSIGVSKVQVAWESMVVNYQGVAYQVSLGGMAGVDKRGRAGIAGTLDDH